MTKGLLALAILAVSISRAHADTLLLRGDRQPCEKYLCSTIEDDAALEAVLRGDRCVRWADTLQPVINEHGHADMRGRSFTISNPVAVPPIVLGAPARIDWMKGRQISTSRHMIEIEGGAVGADAEISFFADMGAPPVFELKHLRVKPRDGSYGVQIPRSAGAPLIYNGKLNGDGWTIDPAVEKTDNECGEPTS